ncbi:MAG: hypothetical protein LBN25_00590 [Christensenellaceae bacterium]|jgi:hypothetical protein|nr:hypothetical protein [Christensenellaceae bacterium]
MYISKKNSIFALTAVAVFFVLLSFFANNSSQKAALAEETTAAKWEIAYNDATTRNGERYFSYTFIIQAEEENRLKIANGLSTIFPENAINVNGKAVEIFLVRFDDVTDYYIATGYTGFEVYEEREIVERTAFYEVTDVSRKVPSSVFVNEKLVQAETLLKRYGAEDFEYRYNFITVYGTNKISPENADLYALPTGETVYSFVVSVPQTDFTAVLYQQRARAPMWYVAIIVPSVAIVAAFTIAVVFINKKKKDV